MNDLLSETRIPIGRLARDLGVDPATVWRWHRSGVRGTRLETFMMGGRRQTTREAYRRFVAASTRTADAAFTPDTGDRIAADHKRTESALAQEGVE
jgi:hypothetical protein